MSAPLHERLAEAAKAADSQGDWEYQAVTYTNERTGLSFEAGSVRGPGGILEIEVTPADARYIAAAQPSAVADLCEQVRVLLAAVQAVEDFISGKPDAPEPFGITRDALTFVKQGNT